MANRGRCENCDDPLRIVVLKFRWSGTSTVWTCPNCAMMRPDRAEADGGPLLAPDLAGTAQQKAGEQQLDQAVAYPITR